MRSRVVLYTVVLVLFVAAGTALWTFFRVHDINSSMRKPAPWPSQGVSRPGAYSSSVVLSIDASRPSPLPLASRAAAPDNLSMQFDRSKQLKPLYDRLAASPAMTA